jgi:hypothetical protein
MRFQPITQRVVHLCLPTIATLFERFYNLCIQAQGELDFASTTSRSPTRTHKLQSFEFRFI